MVLGEGPRILDVGDDVVVLRGRAVGTRVLTVWSLADGSHSKPVSFDAPAFGSALHDGSVYFADRDRIFSRALDADAEVSLVVPDPAFHVPARASGEWAGHGVMVDASFVYYFAPSEADPGHDALVRLPNTGEPAEPDVVVSDLGRVACFAHAADAVAVGTRGTDGGDDASLVVVAKRDKTVSQREGLTTPADVAIDASRVYWVGPDDDSVRALDLVGGSRRRSYP
jgi:hypothetical protein